MSDDPKPKAGFLGGKKPAAPVNAHETVANTPVPISAAGAGFLRGRGANPAPAPEPAPVANPPAAVQAPAPPPPPAAAASQVLTSAAVSGLFKKKGNRPLAEQHLQRGIEHYNKEEVEPALAAYQDCIKADPAFAIGHNSLGMVLIDLERYEEALDSLYESVRLDPKYSEAYNSIGFVMRRLQRHVEAASAYSRFLELEPQAEEGPRIRTWMDTLLKENNLTAVPPFALPGAAKPEPPKEEPPAKVKKMAAWEAAAGDMATAAPVSITGEVGGPPAEPPVQPPQSVQPVTKPAPPPPPPAPSQKAAPAPVKPPAPAKKPTAPASGIELVERGMDQFAEGNLDAAAELFQQAAMLEPENSEGHLGLGKVRVRQENLKDGLEHIEKAISLSPTDPAGHYVRGFTLRALEHNVEAAEAYELFLKLMPNALDAKKIQEWVRHVKGVAGSEGDGYDTSDADNEVIVTESDQKYKQALTEFQEGKDDKAMNRCVKILTEDPAHYRTRVLLGRIYLRLKSFDGAIEQLEGALVSSPDYPEALYFLGQASEKRGVQEKAVANFKRYLEVAPNGPRAERLREWMLTYGSSEAGSKQVSCELCLRFFPEDEITQHDGKATCRNCLAVMGHGPAMTEALAATALPKAALSSRALEAVKTTGKSKGFIYLILGTVAAGMAALYFLGTLNPILLRLGLMRRHSNVKIIIPDDPIVPNWVFDGAKVTIANEPTVEVHPFAGWTYTPDIQGIKDLDEHAKGWKLEYELKDAPPAMRIENKSVVWAPEYSDFEALKKGDYFNVELNVKGTGKNPDGTEKVWFTAARKFTVHCQFGYASGTEINLGTWADGPVTLAAGDFNGDQSSDLVICSGQFRQGEIRLHIQQREKMLSETPVLLAKNSRYSAVYAGDLDGNKSDDLLAADWQRGQLKLFYQDAQQPVEGPSVEIGLGPVALGVADLEGNGKLHFGTLLGAGSALAITSLTPDRKFTPPIVVPLPAGGSYGYVLPWQSADAGNGFVAIVPLAEMPIQFVPYNKGQWNKDGQAPVQSPVEDGLVTGAAVLSGGAGAPRRLALIVTAINGTSSRLFLFEEKAGKFTASGDALTLSSQGVGLLAYDFNHDGQDDLFVILQDQCGFYFGKSGGLVPGPQYNTPGRLSGPAVLLFQKDREKLPDIIMSDENRKGVVMRPEAGAAAPPVAPPTPVAPPAADDKTAKVPLKPDAAKSDAKTDVKPAEAKK